MKKMIIKYELSPEGQKKSLLQGGSGERIQTIETDPTPELLEMATVAADGTATFSTVAYDKSLLLIPSGKPSIEKPNMEAVERLKQSSKSSMIIYNQIISENEPNINQPQQKLEKITFDAPATPAEVLKKYKERLQKIQDAKELYQPKEYMDQLRKEFFEIKTAYKKVADEIKELFIQAEMEREELREQKVREKELAKEKYLSERSGWIKLNGSEYLQDCLKLGYKMNKEYVIERAEAELPGYTVDYTEKIEFEEKLSPSPEAIAELKKVLPAQPEAKIVWMTEPIDKEELYYGDFEPREAVLIPTFLGKYRLFKTI